MDEIVLPSVAELRRRGIDYRGVLYAGLMITADGPKLIEYNVRFGDPEAEVVLLRCDGDVAELCRQVADGELVDEPQVRNEAAVCVVLAAPGYPFATSTGGVISGVEQAGTVEGVTVFHAGTALDDDGALRTAGGRVLAVTALGATLADASARAYQAADLIHFDGVQLRRDIGKPHLGSSSFGDRHLGSNGTAHVHTEA